MTKYSVGFRAVIVEANSEEEAEKKAREDAELDYAMEEEDE